MHPIHAEMMATTIRAERLRHAEDRRRVQAVRPAHQLHVRDRVGDALVRLGTRLQHPGHTRGAPAPLGPSS